MILQGTEMGVEMVEVEGLKAVQAALVLPSLLRPYMTVRFATAVVAAPEVGQQVKPRESVGRFRKRSEQLASQLTEPRNRWR